MNTKDVIRSYLERYAEPQAAAITTLPGQFDRAIVVPAFDESDALLDTFAPVLKSSTRVLMILVANAPDSCADPHPATLRTAGLAACLAQRHRATWQSAKGLSLHPAGNNSAWLLVDCFSGGRRLPAKQGVGLARRIGSDIACALYAEGTLADPWFFSTDADVLPPARLAAVPVDHRASACTLPFVHRFEGDERTRTAGRLYDFYLRYHGWGLATAGSPYAHLSIGSTLVLNVLRYAQVRGFPRRAAGEDFHLLAKLAKLAPVLPLAGPPVTIRARLSHRVPFGTGPAVARIRELPDPAADYRFPHPECFALLGCVLESIGTLFDSDTGMLADRLRDTIPGAAGKHASDLLEKAGAGEALRRARRDAGDRRHFLRHFHTWFGALKTQQFLHGLARSGPGTVGLDELLRHPGAPALHETAVATEAQLDALCKAMARTLDEALVQRAAGPQVFGNPCGASRRQRR